VTARVLFFGVRAGERAGHYLIAPNGHERSCDLEAMLPAPLRRLDGVWCWPTPRTVEQVRNGWRDRDPQEQGRGFIHYVDGWTVVSWWDRSGDPRGGCCAAFLVEGRHPWTEALPLARAAFPREFARMGSAYSIGLAGHDLVSDADADAAEALVAQFRALHPDVRARVLRLLRTTPADGDAP